MDTAEDAWSTHIDNFTGPLFLRRRSAATTCRPWASTRTAVEKKGVRGTFFFKVQFTILIRRLPCTAVLPPPSSIALLVAAVQGYIAPKLIGRRAKEVIQTPLFAVRLRKLARLGE